MTSGTIYPVILSGGSGTRLWPVSRKSYPKQFSPLIGEESLFQRSARRFVGGAFKPPIIVTGDPFRFIAVEQLAALRIDPSVLLIEPVARGTAPAILSAALWLADHDPSAAMIILPSDHIIPDDAAFRRAVDAGLAEARAGRIVTFGIRPSRPETGYGYLELAAVPQEGQPVALTAFVEKPDAGLARAMIADGRHMWNAGIFLATAKTIVATFAAHAPDTLRLAREAHSGAVQDMGLFRLAPDPWEKMENISIDYAIMEKVDDLVAVPFFGDWSDLGGWEAVWLESAQDGDGNALSGNSVALDCRDSLIRTEQDGLCVVGIGLEDMIVVAMPDAVLVCPKSRAQEVKDAVNALKRAQIGQATAFPKDHRPWGWFERIADGNRFQVKRICVKPGGALSLQSHHHRAEHWIVVQGTARVTVGESVSILSENQSVYVPLGAVHRLENPGKLPVLLIEVQTGAYLGEDDILRYHDVYART
jgi:mannose-1-phosphate guanylyltransferase/mannose-6-phosphate isomerase